MIQLLLVEAVLAALMRRPHSSVYYLVASIMQSSSRFASSFAPYTPPPDDPSYEGEPRPTTVTRSSWFPVHPSSTTAATSYQSGGIPTFNTSLSGGSAVAEDTEVYQNSWETAYGLRVDILAALAYLFGPISALILLVLETHNDYVRFHAYQSALLSTPLVALRIFAALLNFPSWLQTIFTLLLVLPLLFMAFVAYRNASNNGLVLYQLPTIGSIADKWVQEE